MTPRTVQVAPNRIAIGLVLLAALTVGCGGGVASPVASSLATTPSPQAAQPTAAPSSSSSAAPSPQSQRSAAPSALALCANAMTPCPLAAGTYSTAPFEPAFLVTVPDGAMNDRAWTHGGEISVGSGAFLEWGTGFTGATGPGAKSVAPPKTAAEMVAFLRSFKKFIVTAPAPITVDGRNGTTIDVTTNVDAPDLLQIPEDSFNLDSGEKIRLFLFDIDGDVVMILEEVPQARDFEKNIASIKPMVDSIAWQD
jgi:hypothetical protein